MNTTTAPKYGRTFYGRSLPTDRFERLIDRCNEQLADGRHAAVVEYWQDGEDPYEYGHIVVIRATTAEALQDGIDSLSGFAVEQQRHA